jgi:GntR family transcriptional regulator/MocR family aminotransferase
VLYIGTFSKVMLPVLRLGFMVVPASLQSAFRRAKLLADGMGVVPMQRALARFIDEGLLARHIRKASKEYAARHSRVVAQVNDLLHDWLEVLPAVAGLHVSAFIHQDRSVSDVAVARRARSHGMLLLPLSPMYLEDVTRRGFVLGYGGLPLASVAECMRRLRACLEAEARAK